MKVGPVQVPVSTPAPLKSAPKAQEQQLTSPMSPAPTVENQLSGSKAAENVNVQESEREKSSMLLLS